MFEIGSSLRAARARRGVELARVEADTRIRRRYLQALEDERFELLPAAVYAKGFLRTYAEYLGLDGERFVEAYNARFADEEAPPAAPMLEVERRRFPVGIATALLLLAFAAGLLALRLTGSSPRNSRRGQSVAGTQAVRTGPVGAPAAHRARQPTPPGVATLVLRATRGRCWILVRKGSERGARVFEGTLEQGDSRHFPVRRLWIRIGAPWNVDGRLAGRRLSLPQTVTTVLVTAAGMRTLRFG